MAAVGKILRNKREEHRLSLEDVSAKTKVSTRFLAAIENEEYDNLPPQSYTIGFVKLYAEAVGLDAGAIAAQFKRETGTPVQMDATIKSDEHTRAKVLRGQRIPFWIYGAAAAAILIVVIGSYGCLRSTPRAVSPAMEKPAGASAASSTGKP